MGDYVSDIVVTTTVTKSVTTNHVLRSQEDQAVHQQYVSLLVNGKHQIQIC